MERFKGTSTAKGDSITENSLSLALAYKEGKNPIYGWHADIMNELFDQYSERLFYCGEKSINVIFAYLILNGVRTKFSFWYGGKTGHPDTGWKVHWNGKTTNFKLDYHNALSQIKEILNTYINHDEQGFVKG